MKKITLLTVLLITCVSTAWAQHEVPQDSLPKVPKANIKEFGGFLLDMGLMKMAMPTLPKTVLAIPDASKDYNHLFRLDSQTQYSQGFTTAFSPTFFSPWGMGVDSSSQFMQKGTFQLKNGMKLHTYGDYNKEGWRVPRPNALPWEKNHFRGAFELKSSNGNFGIRLEVQQGRNVPY